MIPRLNQCLRVAAPLARLSGGAVIGLVLASGGHLLAVSHQQSNVPPEVPVTSQHTRTIAFAPCAENPALDCGTLTVPVDYRKPYGDTVEYCDHPRAGDQRKEAHRCDRR